MLRLPRITAPGSCMYRFPTRQMIFCQVVHETAVHDKKKSDKFDYIMQRLESVKLFCITEGLCNRSQLNIKVHFFYTIIWQILYFIYLQGPYT